MNIYAVNGAKLLTAEAADAIPIMNDCALFAVFQMLECDRVHRAGAYALTAADARFAPNDGVWAEPTVYRATKELGQPGKRACGACRCIRRDEIGKDQRLVVIAKRDNIRWLTMTVAALRGLVKHRYLTLAGKHLGRDAVK